MACCINIWRLKISNQVSTKNAAVFFDRDGVLIKTIVRNGKPYAIHKAVELELMPGARELTNKYKQAGYKIVVVTNQPDVGNGMTEKSEVEKMHATLLAELPIDLIKVCYHSQKDNCRCRKPATGMFEEAEIELNLDLKSSIMIGDRSSDIAAGKQVGCFTTFIDYGYNETLVVQPDSIVRSLTEILL